MFFRRLCDPPVRRCTGFSRVTNGFGEATAQIAEICTVWLPAISQVNRIVLSYPSQDCPYCTPALAGIPEP
ncbi:MAG: hypothetical protein Kow0077_21960 [Anaerolineae bacterium]